MREDIDLVVGLLAKTSKLVVLTGAGVSKESGIPTFRDAQTGIWANFDAQKLATPEGFLADPQLVWSWYDHRRSIFAGVEPNPGHHAVVEMEELISTVTVVTQNIDRLHSKAGSSRVIELHGAIDRFKCYEKHHRVDHVLPGLAEPPLCPCGSLIRPDVVWFGEPLPAEAIDGAFMAVGQADILIVAGTSGVVYPAAQLPFSAKDHGAKVVEINPESTPLTQVADWVLPGPSGEILPLIVKKLRELTGVSQKS